MSQGIILIIDDDPDITEVMKLILENDGYTVETAEDSEAGMRQLQSVRPDLIILDVIMDTPREGFMFSRQLKKNPQYKDIPILMLTSVKEKTGIDFKEAAGDEEWLPVEEFLDKPVKPDELLEKIRGLLKK